jgi:hypothetical protein
MNKTSSLSDLETALDLLHAKCIAQTKNPSRRAKYEELAGKIEKDFDIRIDRELSLIKMILK